MKKKTVSNRQKLILNRLRLEAIDNARREKAAAVRRGEK